MRKKISQIISFILSLCIWVPYSAALATSGIDNPIDAETIQDLITAILKIIVAVGAPVAVLFLIFSGFKFVTAQGNKNKIAEAREYFIGTLVGIVILLGAEILATIVKGTVAQLQQGL